MSQKHLIPFEITGMDSLGQGVSKISEKVTFIPKTVIGDKGEAEVMAERKGVIFARKTQLTSTSDLRIKPSCIHFEDCPSCHYQHVSYEQELSFKKESFEKLFRKLPLPTLEVIGSPQRFNYRNRIQLHYSLKSKLLGMKDPQTHQITPIPQCLIGELEILAEIKRLYENNSWLKDAPAAPMEGHVEIYWIDQQLKVSWNRPYAEGGFTQVYELMNQKLKEVLSTKWKLNQPADLLDLFGGNGNLSSATNYSKRLCVDVYQGAIENHFYNQDLYDEKALSNVSKKVKAQGLKITNLLLDPPRSGLKNLNEWVDAFRPEMIAYVSCDPHTMARDLQNLQGYDYTHAFLIDFFPSTFHYESMIFLKRKP